MATVITRSSSSGGSAPRRTHSQRFLKLVFEGPLSRRRNSTGRICPISRLVPPQIGALV